MEDLLKNAKDPGSVELVIEKGCSTTLERVVAKVCKGLGYRLQRGGQRKCGGCCKMVLENWPQRRTALVETKVKTSRSSDGDSKHRDTRECTQGEANNPVTRKVKGQRQTRQSFGQDRRHHQQIKNMNIQMRIRDLLSNLM